MDNFVGSTNAWVTQKYFSLIVICIRWPGVYIVSTWVRFDGGINSPSVEIVEGNSIFWWNSDQFRALNFVNWSFRSKVMHFCVIFSRKWPKSEVFHFHGGLVCFLLLRLVLIDSPLWKKFRWKTWVVALIQRYGKNIYPCRWHKKYFDASSDSKKTKKFP